MNKAQELLGAWQKKLSELEDMKARGDLTRDWGECSLINARTIVEGLTVIAAEADAAIQPQRMSADYAAWLVEINDTTDGPEYFHLSDDDDWIKDHDKALHFARQADADRVIEYYGWTRAKAVEHMWPSHTRPECGDEQ